MPISTRWLLVLLALAVPVPGQHAPLALHPRNPHYFQFRGKPVVLITSGEHYGAVLNLDFDYRRYLAALAKDGLNLTRTFTGAYREALGNFNITRNTLAPAPGRFIAPWPEVNGKFDLSRWNDRYFARLLDFMREARRRGIVVEMNLFCPYYQESMWELSPLNAKNNINGTGNLKRTEVLTLKDADMLRVQDAMVTKIVAELREFDNLYYEIANEPYFGGVTLEWQHHIARTIATAESGLPHKHLISQNIANGTQKIADPDPLVGIFNFHYARPPDAVAENYTLNKAIGCNETGFDGTADAAYRIQGWDFLTAGGALYNNLDYSFVAGQEDGNFSVPPSQPGGGSPELRRQLGALLRFFGQLDLPAMEPAATVIRKAPGNASARALASPGKMYVVYLHRARIEKERKPRYQVDREPKTSAFTLDLPAGAYRGKWVNTRTGAAERRESFRHAGGLRQIESPVWSEDVVLHLVRK